MMNNTINGRTPDEIKRGLECCIPRYESNHWVTCNDECPYRSEGAFCRNVMQNNVRAYIHQLERERDAAVEQLQTVSRPCSACKYGGEIVGNDTVCEECKIVMRNGVLYYDHWQWRGAPQEVK